MYKLLGVQVRHPVGDLRSHLNHLLQGRGRAAGVILKSKHGVVFSDTTAGGRERAPHRVPGGSSPRPQAAGNGGSSSSPHEPSTPSPPASAGLWIPPPGGGPVEQAWGRGRGGSSWMRVCGKTSTHPGLPVWYLHHTQHPAPDWTVESPGLPG